MSFACRRGFRSAIDQVAVTGGRKDLHSENVLAGLVAVRDDLCGEVECLAGGRL